MLPQKNRRFAGACTRFLKDYQKLCLVSSSVKEKAIDLLRTAYKRISEEMQEKFIPYLEQKNIEKITSRDCLIFEDFFYALRKKMKNEGKNEIHYELIGQIEYWVADSVHKIKRGSSLDAIDFMANILTELSIKFDNLKTPIEVIEPVEISESPDLNTQIVLAGVQDMEDIIHLAAAINFQYTNDTWVIFVTFDEIHILSNRPLLKEICALHTSKPAYAVDYLVELSRLSKPVKFYKEISNHSVQQKEFAKAVETALQINII